MSHRSITVGAALVAALGCSSPKPDAPQVSVRDIIAQNARADTRPDSFSIAADRGRILGDSGARVWVVVMADYQCAECKRWYDEVMPRLKADYVASGRVRVAFLHMPLERHLNGMISAVGAVCAANEGKFAGTTDRIFATQTRWKDLPDARPFLDSLAIAAGADSTTHRRCTELARGQKLVREDMQRAIAAGVDSLPTFFVGSHKVVGYSTSAAFRAVVDSALMGK